MLTPSRKFVSSPFQIPSPIHHRKISPKNDKENCENSGIPYKLLPDEDSSKEFIWLKKEKRDRKRKHGVTNKRNRDLLEEHKQELEKLKKRRLERERIHEERMKERNDIRTLTLAGEYDDWLKEEQSFMLKQAKLRTRLRLEGGRPQPIDLLVYFKENGKPYRPEDSPLFVIGRLNVSELGDLVEDVKVCKKIEIDANCVYWDDVFVVAERYLRDSQNENERDGINSAVSGDVEKILSGKTSVQLTLLQEQIECKMKLGNIDVGFWESLEKNIKYYISFARLEEASYKNQNQVKSDNQKAITRDVVNVVDSKAIGASKYHSKTDSNFDAEERVPVKENGGAKSTRHEIDNSCVSETVPKTSVLVTKNYKRGDLDIFQEEYSPKYLKESDLSPGTVITDPDEDRQKLEKMRQHVREMYTGHVNDSCDSDEEISFTSEYNLVRHAYTWDKTFRARKPRYYNRVIAGFAWNRYNRTHFDIDNPPPKTVRGYKFCIFYQDLIDKTVTPVYSISPCPDDKDLDIIRFSAGPPYEDVAFKIVRGEWNKSVKRGYRCTFNGRALELYFSFKHMCYRR